MKNRENPLGSMNCIGKNTTFFRKEQKMKQKDLASAMQIMGIDINLTSLSKLEGQTRTALDFEVYAISKILGVSMEKLIDTSVLGESKKYRK